ncbi:MAG: DegT/DnrJ/EryC1/StrS family aminotransferase, partial [Actinobacteria bacterium]|nr:DegT/DnrJ/EryC1/StrS family aminotransferase [Actinomycetota bacterium]
FPGAFDALAGILVLPWNERYGEEHVDMLARGITRAAGRLSGGAV